MDRISSNPFLTPALVRQGADLRAKLQATTQEMATGKQADTGATLRGDFGRLAATDHALARISGYTAATSELTLTASAMQSALAMISQAAEQLGSNLLSTASGLSAPQLAAVTSSGMRDFETVIAALNTRVSERPVFGGVNSAVAPLPDAQSILGALETAIAGVATPEDISAAVDSWFAGAGYEALYTGGAPVGGIAVAAGETASLPFTALDPAIRETLAGFAKVALLDRGLLAGDHAARAAFALGAGVDLQSSSDARAVLAGRIGTTEEQLSRAQARNSAEKSALTLARTALIEADPYEATVRLEDLESRLDAFYTITARLSRLSLTEYLR
ncbi:flagellin [Pseudogemmobacter humi]|uniref:Flagellar hook-associated protein FlgL n=1 Tax=Pseudogemmobacter humi TaxID=2483812 RepID=A0A3P5WRT4_9RHOB|nr:flagellin [Pseudogemmobacter humi]VDC21870.1 flagellar hook-associated protein FlgL [Pseudogemmobacter humi]